MDIYFYEAFEEEADQLHWHLEKDLLYGLTPKTIQETDHTDPPARLISIRTQSQVPPQWAGKLDGILSRSTGYDHLLALKPQLTQPVALGYLEEYSTRAVAEQAILLTHALLRKLPQQVRQFGEFQRDGLTGTECAGKKMLVVGVGRIGGEIVSIAKAMGFIVKGVDLVQGKSGVDYATRDEGIRWADVIVCAMNLTGGNKGYFSYDLLFQNATKGCLFVNIARGEISPLLDLEMLLEEGILGGVGLDVFEHESSLAVELRLHQHPHSELLLRVQRLLKRPNVLFTPHNAFNTREAVERKTAMTVQQIRHFLKHGEFLWRV